MSTDSQGFNRFKWGVAVIVWDMGDFKESIVNSFPEVWLFEDICKL